MEAIILAGGLGTRLQSVISDKPKAMAEVAGKPFLYYIINELINQSVNKIILALGFKSQQVIQWAEDSDFPVEIHFSIEDEPLGTGGALKKALSLCEGDEVLVLNGDSYCSFDLQELETFNSTKNADLSILLFPMIDFDRYGVVDIDQNNRILKFEEKQAMKEGNINSGIYLLKKEVFLDNTPEGAFSLEKEYLEKYVDRLNFYAMLTQGIFIDIGIPEDYTKAQEIFRDFA